MDSELSTTVAKVLAIAIPAILAITLHEAAHGFVAYLNGDPTARERGRLSLNPIRHVDLYGTILLPAMLKLAGAPFVMGWAKPVPVDISRLRNPRRGMVWVALAGPGMNFLLALISALWCMFCRFCPKMPRFSAWKCCATASCSMWFWRFST